MKEKTNQYLVIAPNYPPPFIGGSRVWTYNLIENCPANADILTSPLKRGHEEEVSGHRHQIFRLKWLWDSNTLDPTLKDLFLSYSMVLLWLFKRLCTVKYKAVIAGAFPFVNGFIILLCHLFRVPVIPLGNAEEFTLPLKGRGFKNWVKRNWLKTSHRYADGFIVVCNFCRELLISIGIKPGKIYIVPCSVNPKKFKYHSDSHKGKNHILSVGRLVERKGFHFLIDAVSQLKLQIPAIHLTIVGDGPFRSFLEEKIKVRNLQTFIKICGSINDEELAELYRRSSLFVLAHFMLENGDTEGCPSVFVEASLAGLPVIGGIEGGASTAIIDNVTGYLVDPRNINQLAHRIKEILTSSGLAESMGQEGVKKALRDHSPEGTGKVFFCSINKIIPCPLLEDQQSENGIFVKNVEETFFKQESGL